LDAKRGWRSKGSVKSKAQLKGTSAKVRVTGEFMAVKGVNGVVGINGIRDDGQGQAALFHGSQMKPIIQSNSGSVISSTASASSSATRPSSAPQKRGWHQKGGSQNGDNQKGGNQRGGNQRGWVAQPVPVTGGGGRGPSQKLFRSSTRTRNMHAHHVRHPRGGNAGNVDATAGYAHHPTQTSPAQIQSREQHAEQPPMPRHQSWAFSSRPHLIHAQSTPALSSPISVVNDFLSSGKPAKMRF